MNFSLAQQYFYQEIQQPDEHIDLARAALYIAQEEYPDLDTEKYLNTLDKMANEVEERLPSSRYPLRVIQIINQYLYEDIGFTGNQTDYYDARNSFLNDVIERRLGIPITLALVYLEIARRVNFPMEGVGLPGHFLIRPAISEMEIFVDAFNDGEVIFAEDCQDKLNQMFQQAVNLQPEFLATVTKRQFLARMLKNLKYIYLRKQELAKTLGIVEKILLLFPGVTSELRDRGFLYYQLGDYPQATHDLQTYLTNTPNAEDAQAVQRLLGEMGG